MNLIIILYEVMEEIDKVVLSQTQKGLSPDQNKTIINVFSMVSKLRAKRTKIVNSFDHYAFIFKCIQHYVANKSDFNELCTSSVESAHLNISDFVKEEDDDEDYYLEPNDEDNVYVNYDL